MWQVSNKYFTCAPGEQTAISGKQQRLKLTYQFLIYTNQFRKKKKHKIGNYSNYPSADRLMVRVGNCLCCIWWRCMLKAVVGQLGLNAFRSHKSCRNFRRNSVWEEQGGRRGGQISLAAHMQTGLEGVTLTGFLLGPPCQIQWAQNPLCTHERNK